MPPLTIVDRVAHFDSTLLRSAADLAHVLDSLPADDTVRVLLLDLSTRQAPPDPDAAALIARSALPVVAACSGEPGSAALSIALAADIRVVAEDTILRFSAEHVSDLMRLLRHRTPESATDLRAGEAFALGLVTALAPPAGALVEARRVAAVIASRGPHATRLAKEAIWRGLAQPFEQALRFETDLTLLLQTTKDRAEGVRAFLEKRTPQFEGK